MSAHGVGTAGLPRLGMAGLAQLPPQLLRPRYDRAALRAGIVHLGLGAFARAHLAAATEAALQAAFDPAWGIVGISLRHADVSRALQPQQGLYTLALRDVDAAGRPRQRLQLIGCVREVHVAPADPQAVLQCLAAPEARIVTLTLTEKGYCRAPDGEGLDWGHPDIAADLAAPDAPRSALGYLVRALARRRASCLGGLSLVSLDNLPANGRVLRRLLLALAARAQPGLEAWMASHCSFPCSMVDRIVPRTTAAERDALSRTLGVHDEAPVLAEPYFDWALEDRFVAGRPDWACGGARFVDAAAPWETLKLRMVNGAHSCTAYLGAMAGWDTVDRALAEPAMRRYVAALLTEEVAPTLPALPGLDVPGYVAALLQRFANPALAHRTQQIAMDGTQKLPQRLLGTVRDRLAGRQPVRRLALGLAAWVHYLRGVDECGRRHAVDDPQASALAAWLAAAPASPEAEAAHWLGFAPVFGELAQSGPPAAVLGETMAQALASLRTRGVAATLQDWA